MTLTSVDENQGRVWSDFPGKRTEDVLSTLNAENPRDFTMDAPYVVETAVNERTKNFGGGNCENCEDLATITPANAVEIWGFFKQAMKIELRTTMLFAEDCLGRDQPSEAKHP